MPARPTPRFSRHRLLSSATRFPATTNLAYFVPSTVIRPVDAGASPAATTPIGRTGTAGEPGSTPTTGRERRLSPKETWKDGVSEPEGSASPSDPPPRAPSLASKLERPANSTQPSTSETTSLPSGKSSGGDPAGPVARRQESGTKTGLFVVSLALIVLLGAAASLVPGARTVTSPKCCAPACSRSPDCLVVLGGGARRRGQPDHEPAPARPHHGRSRLGGDDKARK